MTLPSELLQVMQEAVYNPWTGTDAHGNNTYGADCVLYVFPEQPTQSMTTSPKDGGATFPTEEVTSRVIADYVSPDGLAPQGTLTLATGLTYTVVQVATHYDENGPYYQELQCSQNMER